MKDDYQEVDDASSDEFHYPTPETPRPTSRSSGSTDHPSRTGTSRVPVDLTPHLTQAPDFRVPTREAPQNILSPRRTPPSPQPQWERDETVQQCRDCRRRFNLLNRRVNFHISILLHFLIFFHTACKWLKYSQRSFIHVQRSIAVIVAKYFVMIAPQIKSCSTQWMSSMIRQRLRPLRLLPSAGYVKAVIRRKMARYPID